MKTVKQIIDEIRADIEIRPDPLDEQLDELLKSYEKEIDELMKVIEYSKPHEGLQRIIKKALERPHGEWKPHDQYGLTKVWYERYKCSNCNEYGWLYWHFCPNCGSDNRKEGEQNE